MIHNGRLEIIQGLMLHGLDHLITFLIALINHLVHIRRDLVNLTRKLLVDKGVKLLDLPLMLKDPVFKQSDLLIIRVVHLDELRLRD